MQAKFEEAGAMSGYKTQAVPTVSTAQGMPRVLTEGTDGLMKHIAGLCPQM